MQTSYRFDKENHIHSYNAEPLFGTSTVSGVFGKPLSWWASGCAVQTLGVPDSKIFTKIKNKKATPEEIDAMNAGLKAWLKTHKTKLTPAYWFKMLDSAYRAHSVKLDDSADEGVERHATLEAYVKRCISIDGKVHAPSPEELAKFNDTIMTFYLWAMLNVDRFLFSEMHTFSTKHWLGGIIDCGVLLKNGEVAIIDFKSSKEAYDSQFWQIAGYDIQIAENGGYDADGNKVFDLPKPVSQYIVFPFGAKVVEAQISRRIAESQACFLAALTVHKEKKFLENESNK